MSEPSINLVVGNIVNDVFTKYNKGEKDELTKEETKSYIKEKLGDKAGEIFTEEEFADLFKEFDKDGNNTLSRKEATNLIKMVCLVDGDAETKGTLEIPEGEEIK